MLREHRSRAQVRAQLHAIMAKTCPIKCVAAQANMWEAEEQIWDQAGIGLDNLVRIQAGYTDKQWER